jgi:anti-sigma28 factor (negative regulator of flagellin synthesis)
MNAPQVTSLPEGFRLSHAERHSPVWHAIEAHLNQRLASLRMQNDGRKSIEDTEFLRGRIAELKALIDAGSYPVQIRT